MSETKPRLAIDLDDVLFDFVGEFFSWHNDLYGTQLDPHTTVFDKLWEAWGGSKEEAAERVPRFFEEFDMQYAEPIDGAVEVIGSLKDDFTMSIVSARHPSTESVTRDWLATYFPSRFEDVVLGIGNPMSDGRVLSKAEVCVDMRATVLIEDQLLHALGTAKAGCQVLLFGERPWNQASDLPSNVRRVESWLQVENILKNEDRLDLPA